MMGAEHPRPVADAWRADAACRTLDPNLFFPLAGELEAAAVAACERCTVSAECLADALTTGRGFDGLGYRAGTDERQRYNLRRKQRRQAKAS